MWPVADLFVFSLPPRDAMYNLVVYMIQVDMGVLGSIPGSEPLILFNYIISDADIFINKIY